MLIQALPKMSYQLLIVLCLEIALISAAPLLLLPIPWAQSTPQVVLQKQLMELQALQQLSAQSSFQTNNQPQPLMVLLPNGQLDPIVNINHEQHIENDHKNAQTNLENEDDLNSIVIDAAPERNVMEEVTKVQNQLNVMLPQPQRAILLVPNGRLGIGDVISAIPFLPIEINVPDTISWAYNGIVSGIGSIISIIGRPFQSTQEVPIPEAGLKFLLNQQGNQNMRPIIMMPIDGPVLPIQV